MLLNIRNIVKKYSNGTIANDGIYLKVEKGEIFGLLGPNGAGKTTLIKQIIGLSIPTAGEILINDTDIVKNPSYARKSCSLQPQSHIPIDGVTSFQAIEIIGRLRGGKKKDVKKRANELFEKFQIEEWKNKSGEILSGGIRRIIAFCLAIVVPGKIVILDEPTNDVDPLRRRILWQEVRNLADQGVSVLLITHNVLEAERTVDRLAIINNSKILQTGTPASFREYGKNKLILELVLESSITDISLPKYLLGKYISGKRVRTFVKSEDLPKAVNMAQKLQSNKNIEEFFVGPVNLEDAYLKMTNNKESAHLDFIKGI